MSALDRSDPLGKGYNLLLAACKMDTEHPTLSVRRNNILGTVFRQLQCSVAFVALPLLPTENDALQSSSPFPDWISLRQTAVQTWFCTNGDSENSAYHALCILCMPWPKVHIRAFQIKNYLPLHKQRALRHLRMRRTNPLPNWPSFTFTPIPFWPSETHSHISFYRYFFNYQMLHFLTKIEIVKFNSASNTIL